ncbi:hypothetical protein BGZ68_003741 [Mortierella alpina]|nr:hypothetical protein BGZ68_003741 [Mortierella alpina]
MPRMPMLSSSSASSAPLGASLTRLPGFLRQESSFSGTSDMHARLFRELNQEERQRAKSATDPDSPFSVLDAAHPTTRDLNRCKSSDTVKTEHNGDTPVSLADEYDGNLSVKNLGVINSGGDTEYHEFEMWNPQGGSETQRRRILLVYYTGWPDHGVPSTTEPLRDMLFRIRVWKSELMNKQQISFGPTVVHCSAGCGRTGTFCVVDTILSVLEYTGYPNLAQPPNTRDSLQSISAGAEAVQGSPSDIYDWQSERDIIHEALAAFRLERMLMVQTVDQFSFCYKAVRDLCS